MKWPWPWPGRGNGCGAAGWYFLGPLWICLGFRCLASRELSGDAVENRGLVLWSRMQGSEGVVNIFRIISDEKCVRPRLWG